MTTHAGTKRRIWPRDKLELPVEVHHWAAAEAAAGTDGESCYEVSTDPWETVLYILRHNQVVLKLCKGLEKRSRAKLSL